MLAHRAAAVAVEAVVVAAVVVFVVVCACAAAGATAARADDAMCRWQKVNLAARRHAGHLEDPRRTLRAGGWRGRGESEEDRLARGDGDAEHRL